MLEMLQVIGAPDAAGAPQSLSDPEVPGSGVLGGFDIRLCLFSPSQLWKARGPGTLLVWVWRVCDSWQEALQLSQGHAGAEGDARLV